MEISGGIDICQMSFQTGATAILLLVCMLSLFSTNCPNNIVLFACCGLTGFLGRIVQCKRPPIFGVCNCNDGWRLMSSAGRSVSPCLQYNVQSLGKDRFRFISPYTTARLNKRQKIFFHTDIVLHSANTSEIQATKKPHNYHKIAVWQKDDRIRKSPLKFCVYYYSELEGDCQASIITELWRLSVVFCVTLWHMRNSVWFCTRSEWACSPIGRPPTSPIHSVRYCIGCRPAAFP